MWIADGWKDYQVIDTSNGEKLEKWGPYTLVRPDPQVIWDTPKKEIGWKKKNGKPITDIRKTLATWSAREQKKVRQEPSYQPPREEPLPEVKNPVPMPDEIRKKFGKFIGGTEV